MGGQGAPKQPFRALPHAGALCQSAGLQRLSGPKSGARLDNGVKIKFCDSIRPIEFVDVP